MIAEKGKYGVGKTPVLKVNHLTKEIRGKKLIDSLSFDVNPGEVFGLLGPNGAGKTTVIRMLVGLMTPTEGEILIHGNCIKTHFEKAIQHVGAIVETPELYKFMSGYKNLLHFAYMAPGITRERIEEVIALMKLEDSIHDPVKTYSLGMKQRLGIAQAILHRPSVLILDEPTNGLDPAGIRELRDYLHHLVKEEKTAVVVSSHLLSEMEMMCDRVAVMQKGKLLDVKKLQDIVKQNGEILQVRFEVDQVDKVTDILYEFGWEGKRLKQGFEIALKKEQIAKLNTTLAIKGVKVYGIKQGKKTLEDRFLEMTEGDSGG